MPFKSSPQKFNAAINTVEIGSGDNYIVTKDSESNKCRILAYNYKSDIFNTAVPMTNSFQAAEAVVASGSDSSLDIKVTGLRSNALFSVECVDEESGCAMNLYKAMKYPSAPNYEETRLMKSAAENVRTKIIEADEHGNIEINMKMNPWEIVLIKEL